MVHTVTMSSIIIAGLTPPMGWNTWCTLSQCHPLSLQVLLPQWDGTHGAHCHNVIHYHCRSYSPNGMEHMVHTVTMSSIIIAGLTPPMGWNTWCTLSQCHPLSLQVLLPQWDGTHGAHCHNVIHYHCRSYSPNGMEHMVHTGKVRYLLVPWSWSAVVTIEG